MTTEGWTWWNATNMTSSAGDAGGGGSTTGMVPGTTEESELNPGWSVSDIERSALVRTIYGLIACLGLAGNALVCFVLLRVPGLRSRTSDFLVHLSLVDLIVCLWTVPFHLFPHEPEPSPGLAGELKCRLYSSKFPLWSTALISICGLVTVNVERFVAIVQPIRYKAVYTRRNTALIVAACWAVGLLSNSYALYVYGNDARGRCSFLGWPTPGFQRLLGVYNFLAYYLLPFLLMVGTQWKVIKTLKEQARTLKEKQQRTATVRKSETRKMWQVYAAQELEKTLLLVSVTYAVCWAPNQFLFLVFNLSGNPTLVDFGSVYYHSTVILAVANSCLNPLIYTLKNRPFRRGIGRAFGWRPLRGRGGGGGGGRGQRGAGAAGAAEAGGPGAGASRGTSEGYGSDNAGLGPGVIHLESTTNDLTVN